MDTFHDREKPTTPGVTVSFQNILIALLIPQFAFYTTLIVVLGIVGITLLVRQTRARNRDKRIAHDNEWIIRHYTEYNDARKKAAEEAEPYVNKWLDANMPTIMADFRRAKPGISQMPFLQAYMFVRVEMLIVLVERPSLVAQRAALLAGIKAADPTDQRKLFIEGLEADVVAYEDALEFLSELNVDIDGAMEFIAEAKKAGAEAPADSERENV